MLETYLALLRGINVGGKNMLPMKDLVAIFAAAGCQDVRSYIQSGNVIFRCFGATSVRLPEIIGEKIKARFGHQPSLLLRTTPQLERVLRNNPFLKAGAPEEQLHVSFLADTPASSRVKELDPHRSPPDEFVVRGQEIYLLLPNGGGRSKLTNAYFDSKLATWSTIRTWRTVTKLVELMKE